MKLLIIADDLTGTMDTAVQLARSGVSTAAMLRPNEALPECDVLAINADTRHLPPAKAYERMGTLLARFPKDINLYLKTDSVLRGNNSAAFAAVLDSGRGPIMFVPAFPKAGRITKQGLQYVGGLLLEASPFADDPLNPMTTSNVTELLNNSHCVECESIPFGGVAAKHGVSVFDCETQEQLFEIADMLEGQSLLTNIAGCAGFAEAVARFMATGEKTPHKPKNSPVLFLSGSANRATFAQLAFAKANRLELVIIPQELKLAEQPDLTEVTSRLREAITQGRSVILATAASEQDLLPLTDKAHAGLQDIFARVAEELWPMLENLAIFGGDTALAVLDKAGVGTVKLIDEIQTGVPLCEAAGIRLVTKSGGLGDLDAVVKIDNYLRYGK